MPNDLLSRGLDSDIRIIHQRFAAAMEMRLPAMPLQTKERYFMVLSTLVGKLETIDKGLHDVLREVMQDAAAIIIEELNSAG